MRLLACLIVAPQRGYDEPAILSYAISSFCPTSADGLHSPKREAIRGWHGGKSCAYQHGACPSWGWGSVGISAAANYCRQTDRCATILVGADFSPPRTFIR